MDVLVAIDKLDDFIHNAKTVPFSDDVRVDQLELLGHIEDVRAGLRETLRQFWRSTTTISVEELDRLAHAAPPVRLWGGVRIDKEQVYDLLDRMRTTIVDDIRAERSQQE